MFSLPHQLKICKIFFTRNISLEGDESYAFYENDNKKMSAKLIIVWKIMTRLKKFIFQGRYLRLWEQIKIKNTSSLEETRKKSCWNKSSVGCWISYFSNSIYFAFTSQLNSNQLKTFAFMMFQNCSPLWKLLQGLAK